MDNHSGLCIVMVIQSYLPRLGGAEKQLAAVCGGLRMNGHNPVIVTRRYKGMSQYEVINGTPVHRVPAPKPKQLAAFCFLIFGFLRIVKIKPDIVHAHELLSPSDLSILASKWLKIPMVVKVLRGGWMGDVYKLNHRKLGRLRLKRLKKFTDAFVYISEEIKAELMAVGINEENCDFIPNGVDTTFYKPVEKELVNGLRSRLHLPDGFLALYSGRLASEKGLHWLLTVWKEFTQKVEASLVIVGSGEEEDRLRSCSTGSVIFTGRVTEPLSYYQASDVFILPSKTEGLSNSMLEAMASGLPVIAANVGAAPEVISQKISGVLIAPDNSNELLKALYALAADREARQMMGIEGMKSIQKKYPLDNTVNSLITLYFRLLMKKEVR
jgi:glycosyltransferase involved in cell wall biosynthesis